MSTQHNPKVLLGVIASISKVSFCQISNYHKVCIQGFPISQFIIIACGFEWVLGTYFDKSYMENQIGA